MTSRLPADRHGLIRYEAIASAGRFGDLRADLSAGRLRRVRRGVYEYVDERSERMSQRELDASRYRRLVLSAAATLHAPIFTGWSAIALRGLPILDRWPDDVFVMSTGPNGRRRPGVVAIARRSEFAIAENDGVVTTSIEFSLIQLCRTARLADALAATDAALRADPFGRVEPLTTIERLRAEHERLLPYRGSRRTDAVLTRAVDASDSPLETASRLVFEEFGFAPPVLQHPIRLPELGRTVRLDFFWPEQQAGAEADGRGKYRGGGGVPAASGSRPTPVEEAAFAVGAVIAEKDRENAVRRRLRAFDRWDWADVRRKAPVAERLHAMGIPVTRRPLPGLLW